MSFVSYLVIFLFSLDRFVERDLLHDSTFPIFRHLLTRRVRASEMKVTCVIDVTLMLELRLRLNLDSPDCAMILLQN
jgi:hypothetical protein